MVPAHENPSRTEDLKVTNNCFCGGSTYDTQSSADRIEQVAFGFMASKVLSNAIELRLFTETLMT
jgi:hypothetical protein